MYVEDENKHSSASFWQLKKECFQLVKAQFAVASNYPNIGILAKEYEKEIEGQELDDVARVFRDNPIAFIKEVRRRFPTMGLKESKRMQEGYWKWMNEKSQ